MARRRMSPLLAAVLSGLVPGLGHHYAGYGRRAAALLGLTLGAAVPFTIIAAALFFGDTLGNALDIARPFFDRPALLLMVLAANVAVLLLRWLAAIDAFWLAGGAFSKGRTVAALLAIAVLGTLIAAPHIWVARRNLALYDLLSHDFSVAAPPDTSAVTAPTTTLATSPTTSTTSTLPATTTLDTTTTTTAPEPPPMMERRVNVLLLGADAGPDRPGLRTDTIIVASVDPLTGATAFLQLPRNQVDLPIPPDHPAYDVWEDCHCYPELANTIYGYGERHPELFPGGDNPGATAVMDLVEYLFGIPIHHYVMVKLLGFVSIIDALGGLTITVTSSVTDEQYTRASGEEVPVEYRPGTYEMDGEEVLAFARVRRGTDDYHRMGRQRCVLQALADKSSAANLVRALPYLVPAVKDSLLTDIPVREWPDFLALAAEIDTNSIVSVRFMPRAPELVGTGEFYVIKNAEGYWIPNADLIRATVFRILSSEPADAAESLGIDPLGDICGTG